MNRRIWLASTMAALLLSFGYWRVEAAEPGIAGKWASDAAVALKKWRDKRDDATPADRGLFNVDSGLRGNGGFGGGGLGNGGGFGGGGLGTGGRGGLGGGTRGGGFGGRDFAQRAGARGGRGGLGAGGIGGGGFGRGGGLGGLPPDFVGAVANMPRPELPEGPTVTMDVKVDSKGKMTGTLVLLIMETDKDEKYKVEEAKVDGKEFTFTTYQKVNGIQIPTAWQGKMLSDNVIAMTRSLPSGAAVDEEPFAMRRQK
ncbi:MAG TPA: hypothetical protein VFY29_06040 [Terriglobia bacterium]|nr:hypothetical protein [Terriglobia bacterium]